jgi:cyclopropane fatty-acyl-phospholipid synthase-like methyltransferase
MTGPASWRRAIERYYDETWPDYRWIWLNGRNLAFHFGYRQLRGNKHSDSLQEANGFLATRAGIGCGTRVLDAGCGIGGSAFWLARERGARVVGLTLARSQVERATQLAARTVGAERVCFILADYTSAPLASGTFDVVWALESLCHAPHKDVFYREAARLLRPGGTLVVAEYMRTARPLPVEGERLVREWLDGWAIPDLDTPAEHMEHARRAGVAPEVEDLRQIVEPSLRRLHNIAKMAYPLARAARLLRLRSRVQHGNVIASIKQWQALERRWWTYGLLHARKAVEELPESGSPGPH